MKHQAQQYDQEFDNQHDYFEKPKSEVSRSDPFLQDVDTIENKTMNSNAPDQMDRLNSSQVIGHDQPGHRPFGAAEDDKYDGAELGASDGLPNMGPNQIYSTSPPIDPNLMDPNVDSESSVNLELSTASTQENFTQPLPRIAIQAFCESPNTGQLIYRVCQDRRMQKTQLTVELGGLAAAIERFHDESTPELLIVETGMRGQVLFEQLEELASVCDPNTKVMIVGAANDVTLYRELMRRGVSEYLVPPLSPLHVIKTISGLFLDPDTPYAGRTIAFIGAKGGVGSSTIAHNVSWHLSESIKSNTILVDLDLSFGTAGLDFNQDTDQTIVDALNAPDRLDQALIDRLLIHCTERLSLFSAPANLENDWDFPADSFESVLDKVRRQAPYMILDVPHTWSPWVRQTVLSADQVVVTVTPDLACLRNAKNLFDLVRSARPNDRPPEIVVNMTACPNRPDIPLNDFAEALGATPALVLPFEPMLFGKAANNGQMIAELDSESKISQGFIALSEHLAGRSALQEKSKSLFASLFSSLFSKE